MLYDLESHAKDGRCGLSRNEDIRRFEGKLIEKQTLVGDMTINEQTTGRQTHKPTNRQTNRHTSKKIK